MQTVRRCILTRVHVCACVRVCVCPHACVRVSACEWMGRRGRRASQSSAWVWCVAPKPGLLCTPRAGSSLSSSLAVPGCATLTATCGCLLRDLLRDLSRHRRHCIQPGHPTAGRRLHSRCCSHGGDLPLDDGLVCPAHALRRLPVVMVTRTMGGGWRHHCNRHMTVVMEQPPRDLGHHCSTRRWWWAVGGASLHATLCCLPTRNPTWASVWGVLPRLSVGAAKLVASEEVPF